MDCLLHNHRLSTPIAEAAPNRHVSNTPAKGSEAGDTPESDNVRARKGKRLALHPTPCSLRIGGYNTFAEANATFRPISDKPSRWSWSDQEESAPILHEDERQRSREISQPTPTLAGRAEFLKTISAPPVCLSAVSRTLELSLQSSFQLSLAVLLRYRTRASI